MLDPEFELAPASAALGDEDELQPVCSPAVTVAGAGTDALVVVKSFPLAANSIYTPCTSEHPQGRAVEDVLLRADHEAVQSEVEVVRWCVLAF